MRFVPLLALALAACTRASDQDTDTDTDTDSEDPELLQLEADIAAELEALGAPGGAVAVMVDGEVVWAQGFGTKHPEGDEPVEPSTLFRIGSVTKSLTAVAALQAVDRGDLAVDDAVPDVIPEFVYPADPSWSQAMTVEDLLTHQSGVYDYVDFDSGDDALLDSWLTGWFVDNTYVMAPAGAFWNYANPNFSLVGLGVERATGEPYRTVMKRDVLGPLGMERTLFLGSEVLADGDYATGLTVDWSTGAGEALAGPESYDSAVGRPAGFAWSSVLDLLSFADFLMDGDPTVLSDELRLTMASEQVNMETAGDTAGYGYGLMTSTGWIVDGEWVETPVVHHSGAIPGFSADLVLLPEYGVAAAALVSTDGAYLDTLLDALLLYLPDDLPTGDMPDLLPDEPAEFQSYVGTYHDPNNVGTLHVSVEDDTLVVDAPLLDTYDVAYGHVLEPVTPHNYVMSIQGTGFLITFLDDDGSGTRWLRNRYFVAERVAEAPASQPPVPLTWAHPPEPPLWVTRGR